MTPRDVSQGSAQRTAQRCSQIMWREDNASRSLGMELLEVQPGQATLRMTVTDVMVNGHGIGHGGFTFCLADSAFAFACNTYNRRTVARGCEISYLAPTRLGDTLTADALERSRDGRDGTYDVTVRNGDLVVARFVGQSREIRGAFYEGDDA